jgi:hypothetical protein
VLAVDVGELEVTLEVGSATGALVVEGVVLGDVVDGDRAVMVLVARGGEAVALPLLDPHAAPIVRIAVAMTVGYRIRWQGLFTLAPVVDRQSRGPRFIIA